MALSKVFMAIAIVTVFLVPSIWAAEIVVGDNSGWKTEFDYEKWAQGKQFHVGDTLVFQYRKGAHNVLMVNGTGFQQCAAPDGTVALTTGNDVITLASPGNKWYICGVSNHCSTGMKLKINVLPELGSPSTSPSPSAGPTNVASLSNNAFALGWTLAIAALLGMIVHALI